MDPTTRVEEPTTGQSQRFSFEAFKFVGDFPFVYLHCSVVVCKKDDPDSRCAQGCVPGLNVNPPVSSDEDAGKFPARLRRAAPNHVLHTYMLSRGPFALRPREDEASILDESEEDLDKEEESVEEVQKEENGGESSLICRLRCYRPSTERTARSTEIAEIRFSTVRSPRL